MAFLPDLLMDMDGETIMKIGVRIVQKLLYIASLTKRGVGESKQQENRSKIVVVERREIFRKG